MPILLILEVVAVLSQCITVYLGLKVLKLVGRVALWSFPVLLFCIAFALQFLRRVISLALALGLFSYAPLPLDVLDKTFAASISILLMLGVGDICYKLHNLILKKPSMMKRN